MPLGSSGCEREPNSGAVPLEDGRDEMVYTAGGLGCKRSNRSRAQNGGGRRNEI